MKKLPFLVIYVLTFFVSKSQPENGSAKKVKPFNVYITTVDNKSITAALRSANDSLLLVTGSKGNQWQIPAENIQSFSIRRKNSVGKGALIGFGIGAVTGIISGLASGDDPVSNDAPDDFSSVFSPSVNTTSVGKAATRGFGFGIGGAIIGGISGALMRKKFVIGGRKETFRD